MNITTSSYIDDLLKQDMLSAVYDNNMLYFIERMSITDDVNSDRRKNSCMVNEYLLEMCHNNTKESIDILLLKIICLKKHIISSNDSNDDDLMNSLRLYFTDNNIELPIHAVSFYNNYIKPNYGYLVPKVK